MIPFPETFQAVQQYQVSIDLAIHVEFKSIQSIKDDSIPINISSSTARQTANCSTFTRRYQQYGIKKEDFFPEIFWALKQYEALIDLAITVHIRSME